MATTQRLSSHPRGLRLTELLTLKDQTDESGRLLLEDSAPKQARKNAARIGILMKTERCEYKETPSRYGRLMNVSAYEALRRDIGDVLDGFAWLTHHYLEDDAAQSSTVQTLVVISKLGTTLPVVLFHRGDRPVPSHRSLPSYVASIFKASRGVFSAAVDMLNKKGATTRTVGSEVVKFADEEGHLARAQTGRVCAASTRLIERTIDVILTGEGADPKRSRLGELIAFQQLWDFYKTEESLHEAINRYSLVLNKLLEDSRGTRRDPSLLFGSVVRDGGRTTSFGELTEELLGKANAVQMRLNRLLGRPDDAEAVTLQDVLAMA